MLLPIYRSASSQGLQLVANASTRLGWRLALIEPAQDDVAHKTPDEDEGCRAAGDDDGWDNKEQCEADNEEGDGERGDEAQEEAGREADKESGRSKG